MTAVIDSALVGTWRVHLTFTEGPREGTDEQVTLSFLPSGVVVHADESPAENGQLARGIGEWRAQGSRFSYWFNVVLNEPTGRPSVVVYVHGEGVLDADRRTFTGTGGSEVYGRYGQLLASNQAKGVATRAEANATDEQSTTKSRLAGFAGELIDPNNPAYESARRVFNAQIDRRPTLIARCATAADVRAAVLYARERGLDLSVRSGGHSLSGWSVADGALTLDLTALKTIEVDPAGRRVRVGAGVTWGELDEETQRHGLAVTGASSSTISVVGATIGGGTGWLQRKLGRSCDNLLAAELISANGEVIRASQGERPDLLWALRGGGGNFGVVTWVDLALHPLPPAVFGGQLLYPRDRAGGLFAFLREFLPGAPDELGLGIAMTCAPQVPFVPEPVRGIPIVGMTLCYAGEPADGAAVLEPLLAEFPPVLSTLAPRSYVDMQRILDPLVPAGRRYAARAVHLHALSDEAIEVLIDHAQTAPSPGCEVVVVPGGGVLNHIAADTSPLPHRSAAATAWVLAAWDNPAETERHVAWARAGSVTLEPFTAGVCLNLTGQEPAERIETAFGNENYRRLQIIKRAYDPTNVFHGNHNIPPAIGETTRLTASHAHQEMT